MRIIHLSDWHNNIYNKERIIKFTGNSSPDIICCTGDMVSRRSTDFRQLYSLLRKLGELAPVLYIFGNHETTNPYRSDIKDIVQSSGATLLNGNMRYKNINFVGIELKKTVYKKNGSYHNVDKVTLNDLPQKPDGKTVLLIHNPNFLKVYSKWGADYVLSGHVHGGYIRLPLIGGVLSPERKLFPKYDKGIFAYNNTVMSVSGGLFSFLGFNVFDIPIINF